MPGDTDGNDGKAGIRSMTHALRHGPNTRFPIIPVSYYEAAAISHGFSLFRVYLSSSVSPPLLTSRIE